MDIENTHTKPESTAAVARESTINVVPVISPAADTTQTSKRWQWIIVSVIALLLVAVAGVAYYYSYSNQPTPLVIAPTSIPASPVPTAEFQTYTNQKYQYSMTYPSSWKLDESDSQNGGRFSDSQQADSDTSEIVSFYVGQKSGGYDGVSLEEYARVAATKEIQNHNSLASIKKITTANGAVGYETKWMVQSMGNPQAAQSESNPITYFEIPGDATNLLRIALSDETAVVAYEQLLQTLVFTARTASLPPTPVQTASASTTMTEESVLVTIIKQAIVAKSSGTGEKLSVTVSKINGDYAQGNASDDGGGGMWFAAKVNGAWKLVWDGNGIINCKDLTAYPNYPKSMIPACFDEVKQDTVNR